ncbi:hypothetical protein H4R33_003659 [Dimargaris cristalligena]|nr:hypothetical protein H4R33_003659 [Dimargaris cristalligena]
MIFNSDTIMISNLAFFRSLLKVDDFWASTVHVITALLALYLCNVCSPLAQFPGPWYVGLGEFDLIYRLITGKSYMILHQRHLKYGPIMRIGVNAVSICDYQLAKQLVANPAFIKPSDLYEKVFEPFLPNIFTTCDSVFHKKRQRLLAPVFSWNSLYKVEDVIIESGVRPLMTKLHRLAPQTNQFVSFNLYWDFQGLAFDIIGRLAFGKSFNVLQTGDRTVLDWFNDYFVYTTITRVFSFLKGRSVPFIPALERGLHAHRSLLQLATQAVLDRETLLANLQAQAISQVGPLREPDSTVGAGPPLPGAKLPAMAFEVTIPKQDCQPPSDILQFMIDSADPETGEGLTTAELASESLVQLVAGTDTTSHALTWIVYALLSHPHNYQRLVDEVLTHFPLPSPAVVNVTHDQHNRCPPLISAEDIPLTPQTQPQAQAQPLLIIKYAEAKAKLPYLEAVIQESLRFYPPAPPAIYRIIPSEGVTINGYFVPGGKQIATPIYSVNHSPWQWDRPDEFRPERWLDGRKPSAELKKATLTFFSGPRGCLGRNLSMMELHLTMTNLVRQFKMEFTNPENPGVDPVEYVTLRPRNRALMVNIAPRMGTAG